MGGGQSNKLNIEKRNNNYEDCIECWKRDSGRGSDGALIPGNAVNRIRTFIYVFMRKIN